MHRGPRVHRQSSSPHRSITRTINLMRLRNSSHEKHILLFYCSSHYNLHIVSKRLILKFEGNSGDWWKEEFIPQGFYFFSIHPSLHTNFFLCRVTEMLPRIHPHVDSLLLGRTFTHTHTPEGKLSLLLLEEDVFGRELECRGNTYAGKRCKFHIDLRRWRYWGFLWELRGWIRSGRIWIYQRNSMLDVLKSRLRWLGPRMLRLELEEGQKF